MRTKELRNVATVFSLAVLLAACPDRQEPAPPPATTPPASSVPAPTAAPPTTSPMPADTPGAIRDTMPGSTSAPRTTGPGTGTTTPPRP